MITVEIMCGSIADSLSAGAIIYGVGIYFILTGKPEYIWLGSFMIITGTIQFVDAAIWTLKYYNLSTDFVSRYCTITVLLLEPIVAYLGYVFFYKKRMIPFEIILLIFVLRNLYIFITSCDETTVTKDGYLKWCGFDIQFINKVAWLLVLIFPLLFFPNVLHMGLIIAILGGTWLYNVNHEAWGSRGCHSTVLYAIAALGLLLGEGSKKKN